MANRQQRIDAGVACLDEEFPGWWERVDLEALDTADLYWCPLGQASGRSADPEASTGRYSYLPDLGFDRNVPYDEQYETLTQAWVRTIKRLRRERTPEETPHVD